MCVCACVFNLVCMSVDVCAGAYAVAGVSRPSGAKAPRVHQEPKRRHVFFVLISPSHPRLFCPLDSAPHCVLPPPFYGLRPYTPTRVHAPTLLRRSYSFPFCVCVCACVRRRINGVFLCVFVRSCVPSCQSLCVRVRLTGASAVLSVSGAVREVERRRRGNPPSLRHCPPQHALSR